MITASRFLLCGLLLFLKPLTPPFIALYLLCGLSDVADGYIARKYCLSSPLGAALDSAADLVFAGILLFLFVPMMEWQLWIVLWIALIAFIRMASLAVGLIKYRTFAPLHTYSNKATGFLLFLFPFLYAAFQQTGTALVCSVATLSAAEELVINLFSKELSRDVKGIWSI